MTTARPPRILTIAGSDSGGGAGIQADIRTITHLGGHAMTAVTAVTAQNSMGVTAVEVMPPDMVLAQISAVSDDIGIDAIKIGMLGGADIISAVSASLKDLTPLPVVLDPVMVATSGASLADDKTIEAFSEIIPHVSLVTPNRHEMDRLGGEQVIVNFDVPFLVKGGHDDGDLLADRLIDRNGLIASWEGARIDTRHDHGTGCTLSAAIATFLGHGQPMEEAISLSRDHVRNSLQCAPGYGAGHGPMGMPER
ncbi:hydroxymethylpyrimidine/phosphomethylpyrimidine kinase [Parasphingorhabdus marina DSM 22363]|uniref:hydroxymethylpyrimidine kinase n=1 Tax=Parasphingorhabdus marina DSM 22363 TaxID=1123272 RepID=A0A1N6EWZ3_9SPHN|nr:bifunctional hydroxymethylpyrimidine kinase/phosphomethylpyrimidine kinase [Parasphingorhabdus marina]SIN87569.1 hydroxymethylpyrimidine/phosphomethylpyrimidine kinase [Parasphingorhabdus marina DSM 22363]